MSLILKGNTCTRRVILYSIKLRESCFNRNPLLGVFVNAYYHIAIEIIAGKQTGPPTPRRNDEANIYGDDIYDQASAGLASPPQAGYGSGSDEDIYEDEPALVGREREEEDTYEDEPGLAVSHIAQDIYGDDTDLPPPIPAKKGAELYVRGIPYSNLRFAV